MRSHTLVSKLQFKISLGLFLSLTLSSGLLNAADGAGERVNNSVIQSLPEYQVNDVAVLQPEYHLPQSVQSIPAVQIDDTVNSVDVEDSLKYSPSIFIRKRNYGDTQPVLASRTWGVNSSARSLVYADGVLLSALIANNNTLGAPRWGMVSPIEIDHIDVLYGPYAASYAGNSMGAVVEISTRMPKSLEYSFSQTEALQDFSLYSTHKNYLTNQSSLNIGDRIGKWSFWFSANYENTHSQPLTYVTSSTLPAGTTGGIVAYNKLGQIADLLGATGILDSNFDNEKLKINYQISPTINATYTLGYWSNNSNSAVQTYLKDASGNPTYAGQSGFASGYYSLIEEHSMQSFSVKSSGNSDFDWHVVVSDYNYNKDTQKSPSSASTTGTTLSTNGKVALLGGTGWSTIDFKSAWHPHTLGNGQEFSFGLHDDFYTLVNPTYTTPDWSSGNVFSSLSTEGNGKTNLEAAWMQYIIQLLPDLRLTLGERYESWRAYDGVNISGSTVAYQPKVTRTGQSPKATLVYTLSPTLLVGFSAGSATRFPTASELYKIVSTGTIYTVPNANLNPEKVMAEELRLEKKITGGDLKITFFQEITTDALISQYAPLLPGSLTNYQYVMNVGRIQNRGIEFVSSKDNLFASNLDLVGSLTYVDSAILENTGFGQFTSTIGKKAPYVPRLRASLVATYRAGKFLALSLGGRFSGKQYSTVDNTDTNPNTYGGFDEFFVLDTHFNYTLSNHWALLGGIDNLLNRKYFLYHPFPQRTALLQLKAKF